jgi:precorrin-2 dehydrogenase/sirohydrochlorin ferrochelatase
MAYYPIFLNLAGRRCVVIGGGQVAERKVESLLEARAAVTVVSPRITDRLETLALKNKLERVAREYRPGDLTGYELAFAATDDGAINRAIYDEARERGVWLNAADDPAHCDFILPSILRRGELQVAVATGGASPALARAIREELERYFTEDYAILSEVVAEVRRDLKERGVAASAESWSRALNGGLRRLIRQKDIEGAKRYLREHVSA